MRQRAYEAASPRRFAGVRPFGSAGQEAAMAAPIIRGRARHFAQNNPHAAAGVAVWATALAGSGARPVSRHASGADLIAQFDHWAAEADADGRTDFYGLQANVARAVVTDGEALLLWVEMDGGPRLRQLPAEALDVSRDAALKNGGEIIGGIEFDAQGRRLAYWLQPVNTASRYAVVSESVRVDARDVLHIMAPVGPGQVRGVSWLAPVLVKLGELDQLSDALLVGYKLAACFAGTLTYSNRTSQDVPFDPSEMIQPGRITEMPGDVALDMMTPPQAESAPDFLSAELRAVAVGLGVPTHLISGDLRQANYSSLRADLVAFRQRVEALQYGMLVPQLLRPVWRHVITDAVLRGRIDAPGFERDPESWLAADWIMPAQPWIDPAKDAAAARDLLEAGLTSRRTVVAGMGWNVEELDLEIAEDAERARLLGLSFGGERRQQVMESPNDG